MNDIQTNAEGSPIPVRGHDAAASGQDAPHPGRPPKPDPQASRRRKLFVFVCFSVFAFLTVIRVMNILGKAPEYDEIWTVQHYMNIPVRSVFSDVSTPNNHVLNTLGIRFFLSAIPYNNHKLAMRMTALLAYCGLFLVLLRASLLLLKNDAARGGVLIVVLLNGMMLHYAETARGYSLQSLFVFGLFFSLLCFQFRPPENRLFNAVMWFLCAVGACLSVSSGVLYVAVLTGLWGILYVPFRAGVKGIWRDYRSLILAGSLWSVFVLAWYGVNYSKFAAGRAAFGESFRSPAQYFSYCFESARDTGLIWVLPCLAVCGVLLRGKRQWRLCALTGGAIVLAFASALLTKGGPSRVYLPLLAPAVFAIGAAADAWLTDSRKLRRAAPWILFVLAAVCIFFSDRMRRRAADPNMTVIFQEVAKLDSRIFVSYKSTDLYVVRMLFRDAAKADDCSRQSAPRMLLLLHENAVSSVHAGEFPIEELVPPGVAPVAVEYVVPEERVLSWLYHLRPVQPGEKLDGRAVLCFTNDSIRETTKQWLFDNFGVVNSMLFEPDSSRICFAAVGTGLSADALRKLEQSNQGALFFRVVSD